MPQELNPKVDPPYVTIITTYSGAGPNEIQTLISEPIEKAVTSVGGLKNITSTSQDGYSTVVMEFEMGPIYETAAADVRDKIGAISLDPAQGRGPAKDPQARFLCYADFDHRPVRTAYS